MNKKIDRLPQYILDLMNGYCKQNSKSLIPICLSKLFAVYFFIYKKDNLFRLKFKYPEIYHHFNNNGQFVTKEESDFFTAISSIASNIAVSNECYKLILKIGNNLEIEICIDEFTITIKSQGTITKLTRGDGKKWTITRCLTKFIDITLRINRQTMCNCPNSDGNIELFFRNIEKIPEIARYDSNTWWSGMRDIDVYEMMQIASNPRIYGKIEENEIDGYCKIILNDDFDYHNNQQVSIETHGTDTMNIWSAKEGLSISVDKYGFGTECCVDSTWEYARK